MSTDPSREMEIFYEKLRDEGARLAGGIDQLVRRASVYHHLYQHSKCNHAFPLIAAHGALWANWYFRWGMRLGKIFALWYLFRPALARKRLQDLRTYADAYREINRQVCIETYSAYYFTERYGDHVLAKAFLPSSLLNTLNSCHVARRNGVQLANEEKRELFKAFFLWEQETLVGPGVTAATEKFHWPALKWIALKPSIRFAYFPQKRRLNFKYFASTEERTKKGIRAFDIAMEVGLFCVEKKLKHYGVMPKLFFENSADYFALIKKGLNSPSIA